MSPAADVTALMGPGPLNLPALPPLSLYLHLPWCIRKCPYCDFNSHELRAGADAGAEQQRYVDALRSALVPDRRGEHFTTDGADAQQTASYLGRKNCTNPIYAASLPVDASGDLCHLARGARKSDMVFLAVIGGVPWQLLTADPKDNNAPFKTKLDGADWGRILGKDPSTYQLAGIDPHMIESVEPRAGIACGSGAGTSCDPIHGREWDTHTSPVKIDLQYACTFELPSAKDCSLPANKDACDCDKPTDSPLCDSSNKTTQTRGKAYPTISQLAVAKALGDQAIVSSICPPDPKNKQLNGQDNPFYGYRPAVRAIIDRLKNSLASQCLPQELSADPQGKVPCLILELFQDGANCADKGLSIPDPKIVAKFKEAKKAELGSSVDKATVCQADQILPADFVGDSCEKTKKAGWCYLTGKAAGGSCPQAIKFSADGNPVGAQVSLQCIKSNDAADSGAP